MPPRPIPTKVKSGSRVRVAIADLGDWMYTRGEDLQGGFTVKVVAEAAQKKQEAPQDDRP